MFQRRFDDSNARRLTPRCIQPSHFEWSADTVDPDHRVTPGTVADIQFWHNDLN
jgi:hypothetical protein